MLKIKHHILYKKDFKKLVKKGESGLAPTLALKF